ncbi:MAG: histidine kinase [Bacteroidia bacterium]|nr:histidine kinase [Bacteroidia bacterium]
MDETSLFGSLNEEDKQLIMLLSIGLGAMFLLSLLVIYFYIFYRRRFVKQEQKLDFYQQKLLDAEIIVQEEERGRIAKDLHDAVGSLLSATKMFVGKLDPDLKPERHRQLKYETSQMIDEAINNVRQIIYDIIPVDLEQFGLVSVLENLFETFSKAHGINFIFKAQKSSRLDIQEELAIFRIVQELVNNTLKYAEATEVSLEVSILSQSFTLRYVDNGKGFDINSIVKKSPTHKNLGLKSIRSRIAFLGASYEINSGHQEGFMLKMNLNRKHKES